MLLYFLKKLIFVENEQRSGGGSGGGGGGVCVCVEKERENGCCSRRGTVFCHGIVLGKGVQHCCSQLGLQRVRPCFKPAGYAVGPTTSLVFLERATAVSSQATAPPKTCPIYYPVTVGRI